MHAISLSAMGFMVATQLCYLRFCRFSANPCDMKYAFEVLNKE